MLLYVILIILSILGIIDASYLIFKHTKKKYISCPINGNCQAVIDSQWSKLGFIRNEVLGLLYYVLILLLVFDLIFFIQYQNIIINVITIITGVGFIYSIYLTYLQKYIIKTYCFYCLVSALISVFLFVVSLFILF